MGVVYNPITKELFSASRDGGAYLNDLPLRIDPSTVRGLGECLLLSEHTVPAKAPHVFATIARMLPHIRGVRMLGSAALDLCLVACGRADGYFQKDIKCWDICAGIVILREAGGCVMDYSGSATLDICKGEIVAGRSQQSVQKIVRAIADATTSLLTNDRLLD